MEDSILECFEVGKDRVSMSHRQLVDDTIFFFFGKEKSFLISNHIFGFRGHVGT